MRSPLLLITVMGAILALVGCFETRDEVLSAKDREITSLKADITRRNLDHANEVEILRKDLANEVNKPPQVKFIEKEVTKVIESERKFMTLIKIIGISAFGLGIGASLILHFLMPGIWYFGLGAAACGGSLYGISIVNQLALPILPYFILAALVLMFIGLVVYVYYHVNWKPHERQGINDLAEGNFNTPLAQKLLQEANKVTKPLGFLHAVLGK